MKYVLKAYGIQEFGKRKDEYGNPHQEDSMFPPINDIKDSDRLFVLCDGMGGHAAGEVASAAVCDAMASSILPGRDPEGPFTREDFEKALAAAFDELDRRDNSSDPDRKMGTTLTFLKLHSGGAFIAHIGDSRVYHIRPGVDGASTQILHMTSDHSWVNDMVRLGMMTHEEARNSARKNIITRAMMPGSDPRPNADIYETADIQPGDYFYLCSDGMLEQYEMENGNRLSQIFSHRGGSDEDRVRALVMETIDNADNHTAFLIHILDVIGLPQAPSAPQMPEVPSPAAPQSPSAPAQPTPEAAATQTAQPAPAQPNGNKTLKTIIAGLIGVISVMLIALIALLCLRFCSSQDVLTPPTPPQDVTTPTAPDADDKQMVDDKIIDDKDFAPSPEDDKAIETVLIITTPSQPTPTPNPAPSPVPEIVTPTEPAAPATVDLPTPEQPSAPEPSAQEPQPLPTAAEEPVAQAQ